MSILSNIDIENICKYLQLPLLGVFCKDQLPNILSDGAIVVNLANSDQDGTHWVCLLVKKKKHAVYFDSYGCPPPKEVEHYLGHCETYYNKVQIQATSSVDCGWFCVACIHYMCRHYEFTNFLNMWHHRNNLKRNDSILISYITKAFKHKQQQQNLQPKRAKKQTPLKRRYLYGTRK